ncbi:hypothetical protein [Actinoplanes teichomyceticus]|uniref:Uncharacterized protein n=1 Tax=Actinoplanes teichomyceticus TaxID=1867 RepID=A0A561VSB6_ACTTI|nr:hypothetical protein [Actinoplanes teichomyceticus]TWG14488.1 hypothetical protein FHX34_104788 [Actinoplanes teichomyceticus]GIF16293.1 hypothetical protein Ate01nite_63250 [Actinoplanes teichomyceticus]
MTAGETGAARFAEPLSLEAVRERVWKEPAGAVLLLQREPWQHEYAGGLWSAQPAAVWCTVLAEAYLRVDAAEAAFDAVDDAIDLVSGPAGAVTDDVRTALVPVAAVWADLGVYIGDEDAEARCHVYARLAERVDDERRLLLAGAIRAIAVYHHADGERGRRWLERVLTRYQQIAGHTDAGIRMLTSGLAAMDDGLTRGEYRPGSREAFRIPVPGGMVQPDVAAPPHHYLASRVRLHRPYPAAGAGGRT